jgi:hypothetical protein
MSLVEALCVMADRVQQVRLAQPRVAVDEQRVVGLRRAGDRNGGGVGKPVAGADDEGLEGVLRVEPRLAGAGGAGQAALRAEAVAVAVSWAGAESAEAGAETGALAGLAGGGHRARPAGDRVDAAESASTEAARAEGYVGLLVEAAAGRGRCPGRQWPAAAQADCGITGGRQAWRTGTRAAPVQVASPVAAARGRARGPVGPGRAARRSPPADGHRQLDAAAQFLDSALVISERSRVSSCSLTNSLGVAIRAVSRPARAGG